MVSITFEQINDLEEHLCSAMLNGEEKIISELKKFVPKDQIVACKNNILRNLTESYKNGKTPFCQLVAAAQAAAVLYDDSMPPVVCCGAVKGNTSPTGKNFMMMLLRAWGIPSLDLGTDVSPETFLDAVSQYQLQFVVCVVFSGNNFDTVQKLHNLALSDHYRDGFSLLISGARPGKQSDYALMDYREHRAAAIAEWVEKQWKK